MQNTPSAKLCIRCSSHKPLTDFSVDRKRSFGRNVYCLTCTREISLKSRASAKANRKCVKCGVDMTTKYTTCSDCLCAGQARIKAMKEKRKLSGLCIYCGNQRGEDGTSTRCRPCAIAQNAYIKKRVDEKRANGICIRCDQPVLSWSQCRKHLLMELARSYGRSGVNWTDLERLWDKQNGKCAITGRQLVLGSGASIDHIVPRCLGGAHETHNMQWTTAQINRAKGEMLIEDFIQLCRDVVAYADSRTPQPTEESRCSSPETHPEA